jgi:competence protein ComEC
LRKLLPVLAASLAGGIFLADWGCVSPEAALVAGATAVALGATVVRGARGRAALGAVAAAAAGALALGTQLEAAALGRPVAPVELTLTGSVRETAAGATWMRVDLADVVASEDGVVFAPARVRVVGRRTPPGIPAFEAALPGERVRLRARLRAPRERHNPGSHPRGRDLERAGVGAEARLVHPALHVRLPQQEAARPLAALLARRAAVGEMLSASGPGGGLLRALALGDRRGLAPETREAFASLGLAHLLAVSGLHLTLVAALIFAAVRAGPGRSAWLAARADARAPALAAAVVGAILYALWAGWGVAVRRALVLLLGLALAVACGRPGARAQPLAAAALLILCFEPEALFEPGAQLSFAASAALAWAMVELEPDGHRHRVRRAAVGALRASATALAATAPLAAYHWGQSAPLALLANGVAVPWTAFVLLPAALAASIAAGLPEAGPLDGVVAACEHVAGATLAAVAWAAARVPGNAMGPRPAAPWLLAVAGLALLALRARRTRTRVVLVLTLSGLLLLAAPSALRPAPPRVAALDVGQGDAILVQGRRAAVLVDAGPALPGVFDLGRSTVVPALAALGVRRLDLVVATHADLDHRGGLPAVLRAVPVDALWIPSGGLGEPGFEAVVAAARARAVPVFERGAGSPRARVGDLVVAPLWPPAGRGRVARNDGSLVVRIEVAGRRVLLPGDLEAGGEAALVASGADLRADVVMLSHHGSRTSSTALFLQAAAPTIAVASAPCWGRFEMPHPEVLERAHAVDASVWWTGRDGAVLIGLGGPLVAWGHAPPRSDRCRVQPSRRTGPDQSATSAGSEISRRR